MRTRNLMMLALTVFFASTAGAQTTPTPPSGKGGAGKAKSLVGAIADTAITSAASVATDTLLGENAGFVAAALNASGSPECPAGLMAMPASHLGTTGMGMPGVPSAGSMLVGAAKSKLGGTKAAAADVAGAVAGSAAGSGAAGSQFVCGTPDQISAAMQAAQGGGGAGGMAGAAAQAAGMAGAMKYTPVGAAISAAPMAGAAVKKLGGMFGKGGQSAESMKKDLGKGRLVVQKIKFLEGQDELAPGFEEELNKLGEALAGAEGQFVLQVQAESGDDAEAAATLARSRTARVYAHLLLGGITAERLTRAASFAGKPAKKGDAKVEVVAAAESSQ